MKFKDLNKDEFKKKWSEKTVSAMAETYKVSKQTIYVWGQKLCLGNREHDYRNGDSFEEYNDTSDALTRFTSFSNTSGINVATPALIVTIFPTPGV